LPLNILGQAKMSGSIDNVNKTKFTPLMLLESNGTVPKGDWDPSTLTSQPASNHPEGKILSLSLFLSVSLSLFLSFPLSLFLTSQPANNHPEGKIRDRVSVRDTNNNKSIKTLALTLILTLTLTDINDDNPNPKLNPNPNSQRVFSSYYTISS
jgi:hypothetical protein